MRSCRVLLVFCLAFAVFPLAARAGKNPYQEHQAAMAREQQKLMQQEKKMIEQQQKAMQQQYQQMLRQHQQMMQQQQKALEAQQHQLQQQQQKAQQAAKTSVKATAAPTSQAGAKTVSSKPTTTAEEPKPGASTKTTTSTTTKTKTHATATVGTTGHGLLRWPHSSTVAYRHLMQLKRSLDAIAHKSTPSTAQVGALRTSLLNVVQNSPRPPSTHVQQFSSHLATALSSRSEATVDTKDLALSLRAAMNSIHLSAAEGEQTLANTQQVLNSAGVSPSHVAAITGDIQFMANEVQASLR